MRQDVDGDFVPDALGDTVRVRGTLISEPGRFRETFATAVLQDPTAGTNLVPPLADSLLAFSRSDSVAVTGVVSQSVGSEFLEVLGVEWLGTGTEPEPRPMLAIDVGESASHTMARFEGKLRSAPPGSSRGAELEDQSGTIPVLIPPGWLLDSEFVGGLKRGRNARIVGYIEQETEATPPVGHYFIVPRSQADVVFDPVPPYRLMAILGAILLIAVLAALRTTAVRRARVLESLSLELEESRNQLREREAHFRSLVEYAADTVSVVRPDGTIVYQSPSIEGMLGWPPADLVGTTLQELARAGTEEAVGAFLETVAGNEGPHQLEVDLRTEAGEYRLVEILATNRMDDPAVGGIVCNARDVTENRALLEQVRHADRLEVVGRLAGGIAHDFNNVLTALRGHAEMALSAMSEGAPGRNDMEEVVKSADRAAALTRQLLAFSRQQVLKPRVVDPRAVINGMLPMLRRLMGGAIVVEAAFEEDAGNIRVDPTQLEQVILNFAVNARDAMPDGGRLSLSLDQVQVAEGLADTFSDPVASGDYVRLIVADTGTGMSSEVLGQIFEPFFTTKGQGEGTGLGLATIYGIVKQSNGYIRAVSAPGEGARFEVLFPLVARDVVGGPEPHDAPGLDPVAASDARVILLVEDEDPVRGLARRVLERHGHRVLEAATPDEALRLARTSSEPIDLLFTDVVMPGMSGPKLARTLREEGFTAPTLFTSGYADNEILRSGLADSDERFLQKPFSIQRMLEAVTEALEATPRAALPIG